MRYIQKNFEQAKDENFPSPWDYESWEEYEEDSWDDLYEKNGIWRIEDDGTMSLVQTDGGEPEDNSFNRDGSWIVGELNRAFQNGFDFGYNKCYGEMHDDERVSP